MKVFITGVNRGLGLEYLKQYAADKNNTVYGTVRSEDKAKPVLDLGLSNVKLVYLDITDSVESIKKALDFEDAKSGFDIIIHNAAIFSDNAFTKVIDHPISEYSKVFSVNVDGFLKFYVAIGPYLTKTTKFIVMSSGAGSVGVLDEIKFTTNSYGASKAATNFIAKLISLEVDATVVLLSPGGCDTDMADQIKLQFPQFPLMSPEDSIASMRKVIENLTPEDTGKFFNFDGTIIPW